MRLRNRNDHDVENMVYELEQAPPHVDELEQLEQTIFHEIKRTEKAMHDMDLREDTDRGMPRIDALNWVLNEILVLKSEEEI
ncbi:MAG: hypothetical protein WAK17_16250 [Candidatus Nitrosopolaris sp.]